MGRDWAEAEETLEKGDARTLFWNDFVSRSYLSRGVVIDQPVVLGGHGVVENGCKVWTWESSLEKVKELAFAMLLNKWKKLRQYDVPL